MRTRILHTRNFSLAMLLLLGVAAGATDKTVSSSGNWSSAATWGGAGVPQASDKVIIPGGLTVNVDAPASVAEITVSQDAVLTWSNSSVLTISGKLDVDGTVTMNGGNITLNSGAQFNLNNNASFTWEPGTNTVAGATLFTAGIENFSATSTLVIKKWYNYAVALGSVVNGNFGNLTLNSLNSSNLVTEWNQNNQFESHRIKGTLTVDKGWITLDKSGTISNTSIGSVVLASVNSSFYGHNGNHNGAFSLNVGSVTNYGGNFFGLSDGNGNITVNVSAGFTNAGNVKIINNTGVAGVSNGDAIFTVGGMYQQTSGDTRIIYNVSSVNSGIFNALFNSLKLTGGVFMAQTGCHTAGKEAKFEVTTSFTAAFVNPTDKFRVASLTSIGATLNNLVVRFKVNGGLTLSGPSVAEFTTSASSGMEINSILGGLTVSGGSLNFNYGTASGAHTSTTTLGGTVSFSGGNTYFSRNAGTAVIYANNNFQVSGGNVYVKGDGGTTDFYINTFSQTGGNFILHNNSSSITNEIITLIITGSFSQTAGILNFDSNINGGAQHVLKVNCPDYTIGGTGLITRNGAGSGSFFGLISFNRGGLVNYSRTSSSHQVQQALQMVQNATTLDVLTGNIIVSGGVNPATDYFRIASGATVNLRNAQFQSGATTLNSGIQVDSGGILKTYRTFGLYDGTMYGAINSNGNMDYFLDPYSEVEYNGMNNQVITGTGKGLAQSTQHKYGILRINFTGDPDVEYVYPPDSNVYIRTRLELLQGEFNLNGKIVTLENGSNDAVIHGNGFLKSESLDARNTSLFTWKNMQAGVHEFPFGYNSSNYLPVLFTPLSGFGKDVSISTRGTGADNLPMPYQIGQAALLHNAGGPSSAIDSTAIIIDGMNVANSKVLDRWWDIRADGIFATISLAYRGIENTLDPQQASSAMGLVTWTGDAWSTRQILGTGITLGVGTVIIPGQSSFGPFAVMSYVSALPIELTSFTAQFVGTDVELKWTTASEVNCDHFTVERSKDGRTFEQLEQVPGAGNSNTIRQYSAYDKFPYTGTSYYRLKQVDYDGQFTYSDIRAVNTKTGTGEGPFSIRNIYPSPFSDKFTVTYEVSGGDDTYFMLSNANGQMISKTKLDSRDGLNKYEYVNGAGLDKGVYMVYLVHGDRKVSQKVIKR